MHQDSFRSVVCRSLSKSLPARGKDGSCPETVQRAAPFVVTLQPSVCTSCQGRESQSYREERSMSFHGDYLTGPSLSKHFAEDLLRGAMDLRESLAMLERFQSVSQSMRHSTKKRRPEAGQESPEVETIIREVLLRPSSAKQATVSNGLHGQVGNSPDELKNVVKENLYRKNLVSIHNEQAALSQSKRHLSNNHPMSKATQQKKVVPRSFPSCAPVQPDKSKSPSLVAKLMGLDGLPSQDHSSAKEDESIKSVNSPRARFDIEMPNSKRLLPQLFGENSGFDTKMRRSEKLQQEYQNVGTAQKGIGPPYNNGVGSMRSVQRERLLEQARPKSPKEKHVVSPTSRNQQAKQTTQIDRSSRERQKPHSSDRNREGRNDTKTKAGTISHNVNMVKRNDKNLVSSGSSRTYGSVKPILQKAPNKSREKTVPRRYVRNPIIDELVAYEIQREICHALDEIDGASTEHSATPSDESFPSADWDEESSIDNIRNDFSESNEASLSTCHTLRTSSTDEDDVLSSPERIPITQVEIKDEISLLLLNDKSFLSRAAELVGINVYEHMSNQYNRISEDEMKNHRLYLDTAAEQLEQKHRQQDSLCRTGIQGKRCIATAYLSLEALLRDISNGIRKLNNYPDEDASGTKDSLHMKLQRDLWCSDASINGVWDMGWQDLACMEETDSLIRDTGEDILSLLIEEAALEMSIH